jgi:hypothetical protein
MYNDPKRLAKMPRMPTKPNYAKMQCIGDDAYNKVKNQIMLYARLYLSQSSLVQL